jgi:HD-like signal output (HDOD) protein
MLAAAQHLPSAPQVLAELNEMLLDPHLQLDDVVRILRRDATLASAIVRVANSALYAGTERVASIEDAVARLGLAEVFRATGLAVTAQYAGLALPTYGVAPGGVAKMALFHAIAMESLAPFVGEDPLVAYMTGLMRPLGLMVIDRVLRDHEIETRVPTSPEERVQAEVERVGLTSPDVAALVLEVWKFTPEVVAAVRQQHLPAGIEPSRLAVLLNVTGGIVEQMGAALESEARCWELTEEKLTRLALTREQVDFARDHTACVAERHLAVLA